MSQPVWGSLPAGRTAAYPGVAGVLLRRRPGLSCPYIAGDRVTPPSGLASDGAVWRTSRTPDGAGTLRVTAAWPRAKRASEGTAHAVGGPPVLLGHCGQCNRPGAEHARAAPGAARPARRAGRPQSAAVWRIRCCATSPAWHGGPAGRAVRPGAGGAGSGGPGTEGRHEVGVPGLAVAAAAGSATRPPGPAPAGLRVFPAARTWQRIPSWEWHRAGVEAVRAARPSRPPPGWPAGSRRSLSMTAADADRRLQALPGIGPWTSARGPAAGLRRRRRGVRSATTTCRAAVGWALAGRVVDDAGMLDLLAPYAGHRLPGDQAGGAQRRAAAAPGPPDARRVTTAPSERPARRGSQRPPPRLGA